MNTPHQLHDPITVEAQMKGEQIYPEIIVWKKQPYRVIGVGRQWADEAGTHVLVEVHDASRMEIVLGSNLSWHLMRYWPAMTAA